MKKLVTIVLCLILVCGCAFATTQKEISDCLGVNYVSLGSYSIVGELCEAETPSNTVTGIITDGLYYIEYRDWNNNGYCWMKDTTYNEAVSEVVAILATLYENDRVAASYFVRITDNDVDVKLLSPISGSEDYYTNSAAFVSACISSALLI